MKGLFNDSGVIKILPILAIVAAVGLISFLIISSTAPFKNNIFSELFRKAFTHAAVVTNLLPNGDFENGLTGWTSSSGTTITNNAAHGGTQAAHITDTGGLLINVSGKANTTYIVSLWVRVNAGMSCSGDCWGGFRPRLDNWTGTGGGTVNYITPSSSTVGLWTKYSFPFTTASTPNGQIVINGFGGANWKYDIDVDDVMWFEKPQVNILPTVAVTSNLSSITSIPQAVTFASTSDDLDGSINYFFWDFGDGGHSNLQNPNHTYHANGIYSAKLTVFDDSGGSAVSQTTITINDSSYPGISVSLPPTSMSNPSFTISGTATPGSGNSVTKVTWSTDRGLNGTAIGTNNWSFPIDLTNFGGNSRVLVNAYDSSGKIAKSDFVLNYQPAATVNIQNGAAGITPTSTTVERYDKFEVTFNIQSSQASNPYVPFETNLTDGMAYLNGAGISVNGIFTSPSGKVYTQPGFIYQPFTRDTVNRTIIPFGSPVWKLRFSPQELGNWSYKIQVTDASGTTTVSDPSLTFQTKAPSNPYNHGFLQVSQKDPRYFEFSDGTPFVAVGNGARLTDSFSTEASVAKVGAGSANFTRDWMSGNNVSGSSWAPWSAGANHGGGDNHPGVDLTTDETYGTSQYSLHLSTDTTVSDPCVFYGFYGQPVFVKPNTNYKISIRLKTVGVTGSGGFTFRPQSFWPNTCSDNQGKPLTIPYQTGTTDWHVVSGVWNSSSNTSIGTGLLTLENVTGGDVYLDEVSIKEDLGNGNLGPEMMPRSNFNVQNYFSQAPSYNWDYGLDLFAQKGLYNKVVLEEKSDYSYNHISPFGFGYSGTDGQISIPGAAIKYQQYFWRYLTARWGFSRAVHSWEFANEQAPGDLTMAENLATFIHTNDPQHHMANTSNWASLDGNWSNPLYKDVDYADAHSYATSGGTSWLTGATYPLTFGSTTVPAYNLLELDTSLYTIAHSIDQWTKNAAGSKPMVIGEVGIGSGSIIAGNNDTDTKGIWFHQWVWPQMNPGGAYMLYWFDQTIASNNLYSLVKPYRDFMEGKSTDTVNTRIPLNNGNYKDIQLTLPQGVNGTGQKDTVNGGAHFWIYDSGYTWTTTAGGSTLAGKTVSFSGLPAKNYIVEIWDTWNNTITTQSLNFGGGNMNITIPSGFSQKDAAVKIYPVTGYIATGPTITPPPNATPTPSGTCPKASLGDIDCDGKIGIFDYNILLGNFGKSGTGIQGDINNSGKVDIFDYNILLTNFGK